MKTKDNSQAAEYIYSHMASEIAALQGNHNYKIFAISDCNQNAGAWKAAKVLADRFARMGKKTLLISGDLYGDETLLPETENKKKGFSDFIMEDIPIKDVLIGPDKNMFYYIGRGSNCATPKEQLLCSGKTEQFFSALAIEYDIIFCVTPSLTAPVSGKFLCKFADTTFLVAAMGKTKKSHLRSAKRQLDELKISISGIIATQADRTAWEEYIRRFDDNIRTWRGEARK